MIQQTHQAYFAHQAHIATTVSYQASIPGLTKHLAITHHQAAKLVQETVLVAQKARQHYLSSKTAKQGEEQALLIAGGVGPYGAYLADGSEYTGSYKLTQDQYCDFHRGRIAALIASGVQLLAIETIPNLDETKALATLLHAEFPDTEAWFSFTLQSPTRLSDGTPIQTALSVLEPYDKVVAVGVNCVPPKLALDGLKEMRKRTQKPLIVYANSGEEWDAAKRDWKGEKSQAGELKQWVKDVWDTGARVIGGCCRTGPEDIAVIAETIKELNSSVSA